MRSKLFIGFILLSSVFFYSLGLVFPLMGTKNQVLGIVWEYQDIRLFDSVRIFWLGHEYLLATIIFVFTIVFPVLKYIELLFKFLLKNPKSGRLRKITKHLDKWSMIDVFLVALLILNFKMDSSIIVMKLKIGTSFLAISVVLSVLVNQLNKNNYG